MQSMRDTGGSPVIKCCRVPATCYTSQAVFEGDEAKLQ